MESERYQELALCKLCEFYEPCKANEFKHPISKQLLPKVSRLSYDTLELYNLIKIGVKFTKQEIMDTSNKTVILLQILTSRLNEKQVEEMKKSTKN